MEYSAIVVAAGSGSRTGLSYNKVFYKIETETVIEKSINQFNKDSDCKEIILVINEKEKHFFESINLGEKIVYVKGGNERQESVYNGLIKAKSDYVMIHDGARPYLTYKIISDIKKALLSHDAVITMVKSIDTTKLVVDGMVEKTLEREKVYHAQTPQAFKKDLITKAYEALSTQGLKATDDAQVIELMTDEPVKVIDGDYKNIKITTINDL